MTQPYRVFFAYFEGQGIVEIKVEAVSNGPPREPDDTASSIPEAPIEPARATKDVAPTCESEGPIEPKLAISDAEPRKEVAEARRRRSNRMALTHMIYHNAKPEGLCAL